MNCVPEFLPHDPREMLARNPRPQLRQLAVAVREDAIVIRGCVESYYLKQLAQEALRPVLPYRRLVNLVEVSRN